MRTIIIDDEYLAQEGLKMELAEFPEIEVIGQFADVQDFLVQVGQLKPDLLFVDIEMPLMNGFDLINALQTARPGQQPIIVLVTAYAQYAVQAFETSVTDYLLKPVTAARLKKTMARILPVWQEKMKATREAAPSLEDMPNANLAEQQRERDLTLHCFGPFNLTQSGKSLDLKWRSKKEVELLAYLACQRGQAVSKERIADALWPELDSKRASANLYLTYHYLQVTFERTQLKLPIISVRSLMRLDLEHCTIDLIEFDQLVKKVQKSQGQARIQTMDELCTRFSQPLLDTIHSEWGTSQRHATEILLENYRLELARWYVNTDPSKSAFFNAQIEIE